MSNALHLPSESSGSASHHDERVAAFCFGITGAPERCHERKGQVGEGAMHRGRYVQDAGDTLPSSRLPTQESRTHPPPPPPPPERAPPRPPRGRRCKLARNLSASSSARTQLLSPSPSLPAPTSPPFYLLAAGPAPAPDPGGAASEGPARSPEPGASGCGAAGSRPPGSEHSARGGLPTAAALPGRRTGSASSAIGSSPRLHPGGLGRPLRPLPRPPGCSQSEGSFPRGRSGAGAAPRRGPSATQSRHTPPGPAPGSRLRWSLDGDGEAV